MLHALLHSYPRRRGAAATGACENHSIRTLKGVRGAQFTITAAVIVRLVLVSLHQLVLMALSLQGQSAHWTRGGHRVMCKTINSWLASPVFQRLDAQRRGDALLLSHFLAAHRDSPAETEDLLDLLPHPSPSEAPPVCPPLAQSSSLDIQALFSRFENNNFVVHSHLTPIAHGIFTIGSRTLNHSCEPDCVPLFAFNPAQQPTMKVVLVKDIKPGDELTIPYVDPALDVRTRRERLKSSYGFDCNCSRCTREMARASAKAQTIRPQVGVDAAHSDPTLAIPVLSAEFSDLAHGDAAKYVDALEVGDRLLANYRRVYPPFYPLIGTQHTVLY